VHATQQQTGLTQKIACTMFGPVLVPLLVVSIANPLVVITLKVKRGWLLGQGAQTGVKCFISIWVCSALALQPPVIEPVPVPFVCCFSSGNFDNDPIIDSTDGPQTLSGRGTCLVWARLGLYWVVRHFFFSMLVSNRFRVCVFVHTFLSRPPSIPEYLADGVLAFGAVPNILICVYAYVDIYIDWQTL
jgi:hypothetical protein